MDRRNGRGRNQPQKKKAAGKEAPVVLAHEARMLEEEERLVRLTMELSLKEAAIAEAQRDSAEEVNEAPEDTPFRLELKNALFSFDPALKDLIDPTIEIPTSNNSSSSLAQQYLQQIMPGGREKAFKDKLQIALLVASILGYPRVVSHLIERGADPSVKSLNGWTVMHWAAALGHVSVIRILLQRISSNNLLHEYKDKAEMTPLDVLAQELEQIPVKIPIEVLKVFGRWRTLASSDSGAQSAADVSLFTGGGYKANQMEYLNDEEYEEFLKSTSELAESAEFQEDTEEAALAAEDAEAQRLEHPPSQLFAWGSSAVHLQGHGDMAPRSNPKKVATLEAEDLVAISTSQFMSAAVTRDGKAYIWGLSDAMRLGTATNSAQETNPVELSPSLFDNQPVSSVSLSNYHGAFVTQDGTLYTFGRGREGQLGLGQSLCDVSSLNDVQLPPTLSYLNRTAPSSSSSLSDSAGKRSDASKNPFGNQLTSSSSSADSHTAELKPQGGDPIAHSLTRVKLSSRIKPGDPQYFVTQIACSDSHTAILTQSGTCWTFGNGSKGQLGHDHLRGEHSPRQVRAIADYRFQHVSVGPTHTVLATKTDLWVFGFNNPSPRRQAFAFGNPRAAVRHGLLPSFAISALASGPQHFLVLTREGDVFSWIHGIDKYPVPINVDIRQLEKTRQHYEASLAHSGFSVVHGGSSDKTPISLSPLASSDHKSGIDRERHHVVAISVCGSTNYLTTSDGLVFSFTNSQRRATSFARLPIQPRLRLFAPGRSHYLAAIDRPAPPRESTRPPVPPRLLPQHLQAIFEHSNFTDVEFECQGEIRRGHRFILSVSPLLASTFKSLPCPAIIKLPDTVPIIALDLLLSFVYYGQFLLPETYKDKDPRKVLSLKVQDKEALITLASEWGFPMIADLIQEGKSIVNAHLHIQTTDESSSLNSSSDSVSAAVTYRPWIRHLQNHLATQIGNPMFADAILVVGQEANVSSSPSVKPSKSTSSTLDTEIPIHRALVVERSEWLRMTLSMASGWTESQSQKIAMPHLRPESARFVLSYLYTDSLPNRDGPVSLETLQMLTDLTATADELLLPELKLIVARRLSRTLSPENVASVLDVAETYGAEDLFACIIHWIASNVELLLRLGALSELTHYQMSLVEQVVLEERGVHAWRYFKSDVEDKVLKLASSNLLATSMTASGSVAPSSSASSLESTSAPSGEIVESDQPSSVSVPTPTLQSTADDSEAPPKPSANAYVPPNRRKVIQEEQRQTTDSSSSASGLSSFAQIQQEQMELDAKAAAAAAAAAQKHSTKHLFTWASPAAAAAPKQPAIVNRALTSKSTSLWPELPGASPQVSEMEVSSTESAAAPTAAPAAPISTPMTTTASNLTAAPAKKGKALKSPLRDPKTLTEKDAVFTPKPAAPTAAETPAAKSTSNASSNAKSTASTPAPSSPAHAKPAASASKALNAAAAEYVPSSAKPTASAAPAPSASPAKQGRGKQHQNAKKSSAHHDVPSSTSESSSSAPSSQTQHNKPQNQSKPSKPKGPQQKKPKNEFGGAMKPSSNKPSARPPAPRATTLTADEELAIAISRSLAESSMNMSEIQKETAAEDQHRQRSLREIQEEERQIEEQRALEAYFAAKHAEQSALKDSQGSASSSSNRRQNQRK